MKIIRFSLFCCFGLTLAFSHTAQLWAKAPLIPKIVFSFWQDGGRGDIYLMDPDGSNKVNQDLRKIGFHAKIEGIFPKKAQCRKKR